MNGVTRCNVSNGTKRNDPMFQNRSEDFAPGQALLVLWISCQETIAVKAANKAHLATAAIGCNYPKSVKDTASFAKLIDSRSSVRVAQIFHQLSRNFEEQCKGSTEALQKSVPRNYVLPCKFQAWYYIVEMSLPVQQQENRRKLAVTYVSHNRSPIRISSIQNPGHCLAKSSCMFMHTCCTQCLYFRCCACSMPVIYQDVAFKSRGQSASRFAVLVLPAPAAQLMSVTTTSKRAAFHAVGAAAPALRAWWIQVLEVVLVCFGQSILSRFRFTLFPRGRQRD